MVSPEHEITAMMANERKGDLTNSQINDLSNRTVSVLGTVEMHALDALNKPHVEKAVSRVRDKERGSWVLCRALIEAPNDGDSPIPAEKTGFIILKDQDPLVFYSNNLASTPLQQIMEPNEDAIRCVHGVVPMDGLVNSESEDCAKAQIPAVIAAYKTLKAGVSRVENIKSHEMAGGESFAPQKDITLLLDTNSQNTFSVLRIPTPPGKQPLMVTVHDFNQSIGNVFTQSAKDIIEVPFQTNKQQTQERSSLLSQQVEHFLFESEGGRHSQCYLCKHLRTDGKRSSSIYSCSACQHAFHVNCFTMYHYYDKLRQDKPELFQAIKTLHVSHGRGQGKRRDRKFKRTVTFSSAKLPFDPKQQAKAPN